ncbi:hypothetical protein EJB05_29582, partial [Eragrostis curvula]
MKEPESYLGEWRCIVHYPPIHEAINQWGELVYDVVLRGRTVLTDMEDELSREEAHRRGGWCESLRPRHHQSQPDQVVLLPDAGKDMVDFDPQHSLTMLVGTVVKLLSKETQKGWQNMSLAKRILFEMNHRGQLQGLQGCRSVWNRSSCSFTAAVT